jgi:hypothetical protein
VTLRRSMRTCTAACCTWAAATPKRSRGLQGRAARAGRERHGDFASLDLLAGFAQCDGDPALANDFYSSAERERRAWCGRATDNDRSRDGHRAREYATGKYKGRARFNRGSGFRDQGVQLRVDNAQCARPPARTSSGLDPRRRPSTRSWPATRPSGRQPDQRPWLSEVGLRAASLALQVNNANLAGAGAVIALFGVGQQLVAAAMTARPTRASGSLPDKLHFATAQVRPGSGAGRRRVRRRDRLPRSERVSIGRECESCGSAPGLRLIPQPARRGHSVGDALASVTGRGVAPSSEGASHSLFPGIHARRSLLVSGVAQPAAEPRRASRGSWTRSRADHSPGAKRTPLGSGLAVVEGARAGPDPRCAEMGTGSSRRSPRSRAGSSSRDSHTVQTAQRAARARRAYSQWRRSAARRADCPGSGPEGSTHCLAEPRGCPGRARRALSRPARRDSGPSLPGRSAQRCHPVARGRSVAEAAQTFKRVEPFACPG